MSVTGEQLYNELCDAAGRSGQSLAGFVAPLFSGNSWKIEQLRIAKAPTQITINRVRALIAGGALPPHRGGSTGFRTREAAEAAGARPSRRSITETRQLGNILARKAKLEHARNLAEMARETRRPGQTLADRVRELAAKERAA